MTDIDPRKVNLSEKDIEDWIEVNPDCFGIYEWIERQYPIPSGKADLFGMDQHGNAVVIEVKNIPLTSDAVAQVCRYAHDVRLALDKAGKYGVEVRKFLVGKRPEDRAVLFEAAALNVEMYFFGVELHLDVFGPWHWGVDDKRALDEAYQELAAHNRLDMFENPDEAPQAEAVEDHEPGNGRVK